MPAPDARLDSPSLEQKETLNKLFGSLGNGGQPLNSGFVSVDWSTWSPMVGRPPNCDGFYEKSPYQDEADAIGVPVIPALPDRPGVGDPNPVVAICGACGRKVHQVEMYSCSKGNCPIQPRAVF